jgi:hypothetical protein
MKAIVTLAGAAALGLSAHTALGYSGTATLTFTIGGSAQGSNADQGFSAGTGAGPIAISSMSNTTMFSTLSGANLVSYYDPDYATVAGCTPGAGVVPATATTTTVRKYGCRYTTPEGDAIATDSVPVLGPPGPHYPVTGEGPLAQASGTLTVTDTTLTGTLTIVPTSDEPTGATTIITTSLGGSRFSTSVGDGFAGYNYRTADGSPFGPAWYGIDGGTYTLNLTGTFTQSSWNITGGSALFVDPNFACQQIGFGGLPQGTLCTGSTTGGGWQLNGQHLSWGMDPDGRNTGSSAGPITVNLAGGSSVILGGILASLTIDASGNITSSSGEFRRAVGNSLDGCPSSLTYDTGTSKLTCGSLNAGNISITGTAPAAEVIPVPAAVWLFGGALGALGWLRRRQAAA